MLGLVFSQRLKKVQGPLFLVCLPLLLICSSSVRADDSPSDPNANEYKLFGQELELFFYNRGFDGKLWFPKVYCAAAPRPNLVISRQDAMFNGGAVYRGRLLYPNDLMLAIVFSSIPRSRTEEEEIQKLLTRTRNNQQQVNSSGGKWEVEELVSDFGPMIGQRINNIISDTKGQGPFPLSLNVTFPTDGKLFSMSVHRIFVHGHDRFEVAAMQLAPKDQTVETEAKMQELLTSMVETTTESLQQCTAAMPDRLQR